jgi:TRAP-type mannitol/chloroaromatic compound transport system permease large subunit
LRSQITRKRKITKGKRIQTASVPELIRPVVTAEVIPKASTATEGSAVGDVGIIVGAAAERHVSPGSAA